MNEFYVSLSNYLAQAKQLSATLNQAGSQEGVGDLNGHGNVKLDGHTGIDRDSHVDRHLDCGAEWDAC